MAIRFTALVKKIQSLSGKLDSGNQNQLRQFILQIAKDKLPLGKTLIIYTHSLLFICVHPFNKKLRTIAERELARITKTLIKSDSKKLRLLQNSGLPFTTSVVSYSHDCLVWLNDQSFCKLELINQSDYSLNRILEHTLPPIERSNTTAEFNNEELLNSLMVGKHQYLPFFLSQFNSLYRLPTIKDLLFDKLELEVKIAPTNRNFSKAYNRIHDGDTFFQHDWIKKINIHKLIEKPTPPPSKIFEANKGPLIDCIKMSMALNNRETDPTSYLHEASLRFYQLERGVSIAIYGIIPCRQLPVESYVGYTAFKNGFPVAYGGSWLYGKRANFGINIFESFRGGESSYIMGQILRVYSKVFNISYFEIEPYQYGLDNPEGIESGAFWFYYRNGFRPVDKKLSKLAKNEFLKISASKSKKSNKSVLKKFTESNMALNLGTTTPPSLPSLTKKVTLMINRHFAGDRQRAMTTCVDLFKSRTKIYFTDQEFQAPLEEMALLAKTLNITSRGSFELMVKMIETKPNDIYSYQQLLIEFLEKEG